MIIVLSPAKSLDLSSNTKLPAQSEPQFLEKAARINAVLKTLSPKVLESMQAISTDLANLNHERNQAWNESEHRAFIKPAIATFSGDVYQGLDVSSWDYSDYEWANQHLYILSGLYGLLRPLDQILPYRLEMGTSLKVGNAVNLYGYWRESVTQALNNHPEKGDVLLDLASVEYGKAIDLKKLNRRRVQVTFKDEKNGDFKIISFFAKKARGLMAAWIVKNKITKVEELIHFEESGYFFVPKLSSEAHLIFHKAAQ
jgi:uncharacterized protein